jgi:hypothetical protein
MSGLKYANSQNRLSRPFLRKPYTFILRTYFSLLKLFILHCKKKASDFPVPSWEALTKFYLAGYS